jgi:diguanylate cyclase (GGDEF)-like protein/PAS domain S-box-containing protein
MVGCLHWLFLFHDDLIPATFIPGKGLTPLKIYYEYALVALNLASAFVLWMRMRKPLSFNAAGLFGVVCVMALSEYLFTLYADVTDIYNLLGHIYKAVSYLFLYRAIFVTAIEHPYNQLQESQNQLQATLNALPDLLFEVGLDGRYYNYHSTRPGLLAAPASEFIGKTISDILPPDAVKICLSALHEAHQNGYSQGQQIELIVPDGKRWFELSVSRKTVEPGQGPRFIILSRDITERKDAEEEINHLAFYDHLTSLPNRRLLTDRLQHALASSARSGQKGALLFVDLDNFKTLSDTLGYDMGDLLLQQTAQRLEFCVRKSDTVAHLEGDVFVVMLEDLSAKPFEAAAQTEAVGEKILAAISQPYQLAAYEYNITASIGVILFGDHPSGIDELLKHADIAMFQAKTSGRNTLRFFDPQMQDTINARAALESELRKALVRKQLHLYYQIQVDNSSHSLGAEALIRWLHPERGMISPAQFIPLAEETGLILPIGLWVLETACAQIKAWQQEALTRDLALAINVSARQFHQADFVAQVQGAVQRHAINPRLLKLELTESLLLDNIEETIATMNALSDFGVQLSLDDFGTGYSSLQYLKRLPLDQLKIDQSFVRDIATDSSDKAIVRTIIAMAQSLDMSVIAEGVETEEQRQLLLDRGCTHYQGYLFGKPVPIEQFVALLKQG